MAGAGRPSRPRYAAGGPARLIALALAAAHVALKAPRLGASSLWLDEAVAVHLSQLDFLGIVQASRQDTTPPLYYLLLGAFERLFGISETAVRMPSVLASGATAAALFLLARWWSGSFTASLASALFLLSDVNLRYAREARPYALASLLCVLSFTFFLHAIERPRLRAWLALAAVNGLMLFTHYATVFAVAAQVLALLWPWRGREALRRFASTHAVVGAAFLVWTLPLVSRGLHHRMDWLAAPSPGQLWSVLNWFSGGLGGGIGFAVLLVGAGAALAIGRTRGEPVRWRSLAPIALWGLAPLLLAFGASFLVRCFHGRYLLYATQGLVLLWAAAAQALPAGRLRVLGAAAACAVAVMGFGRSARCHGAAWREATEVVRARGADRILLVPAYEVTPFAFYYDRDAFRDVSGTGARLARGGVRAVEEGVDLAALDLGTARDVFLVVVAPEGRGRGVERQLSDSGFAAVERHQLEGVTLSLFRRSEGVNEFGRQSLARPPGDAEPDRL